MPGENPTSISTSSLIDKITILFLPFCSVCYIEDFFKKGAMAGLSPNRLRNLFARFRTNGLIVDRLHLYFHHVSGRRQFHRGLFKFLSHLVE